MTKNEIIGQFTIADCGDQGATIAFARDASVNAALRAAFPKIRWSATAGAWSLPGAKAMARLRKFADDQTAESLKSDKARERALSDLAFDGGTLRARRAEILSQNVVVTGDFTAHWRFAYCPDAIAIARTLPRARFDKTTKEWTWSADTAAQVDEIIAGLNTMRVHLQDMQNARSAGRAERDQTRSARRAQRYIVLAGDAPRPGDVIRLGGDVIVIDGLGERWRADDELSSIGGPFGCEGEWVRYAYYRLATAEEAAALESREAAAADRARRLAAQREAIAMIAASDDRPALGGEPAGEIIWRDDSAAASGYATRVVLTPDGHLWHITYDGSDGAAWGEYNLGYNTHGGRIPATPDLVAAIRDGYQ